ncbi:MAG: DUF2946 family protein [Undibacterium sp.]|nr:DUF2946 family protein [Undibacterium sp.]
MDESVRAAMTKWPNVPHCYGWLALDARGNWRMRDERAQALGMMGDLIHNVALRDFICRNYSCDEQGNWYFQNGPQKVYIDLAATPYIAHQLPDRTWNLHTGIPMPTPTTAYLLDDGNVAFSAPDYLCQVDDRDLVHALDTLIHNGTPISEANLTLFLEDKLTIGNDVRIRFGDLQVAVERCSLSALLSLKNYRAQARP